MPEPRSLLGDITDATAASPVPPSCRSAEDLLRLDDDGWRKILGAIAPDDLVVLCATASSAWRERVLVWLDQDSRNWLRANLASLDAPSATLRSAVHDRLLAIVRPLLRDGAIILPPAEPAAAIPPAQKPAASLKPGMPPQVPVTFTAPGTPATAVPEPRPAGDGRPVVGAVNVSFGNPPSPPPSAPAAGGDLVAIFADLTALRNRMGVAALKPLAADVADPFLGLGLELVAAGLPPADLERHLDMALAKAAEAYLDRLTTMRDGLLALARGGRV